MEWPERVDETQFWYPNDAAVVLVHAVEARYVVQISKVNAKIVPPEMCNVSIPNIFPIFILVPFVMEKILNTDLKLRKKSAVNLRLTVSMKGKARTEMLIWTMVVSPPVSLGISSLA